MAIEVFNRYENKYMIDQSVFEKLLKRLSVYMEPDEYNRESETYPITNLYYDTADSSMVRTSISKPRYKEKLRVRAYGEIPPGGNVYVELKKKFSGLVNKRRSAMTPDEAEDFIKTGVLPSQQPWHNTQVLREVAYLLERQALTPSLYLAYERRAYFGVGQHDLRISFDRNILVRRSELSLKSQIYGRRLLPEGSWLMEVKVAQSIPVWLCKTLSEYSVFPTSFSKYGEEYCQMLESRESGRVVDMFPQASAPLRVKAVNA